MKNLDDTHSYCFYIRCCVVRAVQNTRKESRTRLVQSRICCLIIQEDADTSLKRGMLPLHRLHSVSCRVVPYCTVFFLRRVMFLTYCTTCNLQGSGVHTHSHAVPVSRSVVFPVLTLAIQPTLLTKRGAFPALPECARRALRRYAFNPQSGIKNYQCCSRCKRSGCKQRYRYDGHPQR